MLMYESHNEVSDDDDDNKIARSDDDLFNSPDLVNATSRFEFDGSQYSLTGFPFPFLGIHGPEKPKVRDGIISPNNPFYRYVTPLLLHSSSTFQLHSLFIGY